MKKTLLALLLSTTAAFAADIPVAPTFKAPPIPASITSGFVFGLNGAFAVGKSSYDFVTLAAAGDSLHPAGGLFGLTVGYQQWNGSLRFGLLADFDRSFNRGGTTCAFGMASCSAKDAWELTQVLRVSAALPALTGALPSTKIPPPSQWPLPIALPASISAATIAPYLEVGVSEKQVSACVDAVIPGASSCAQEWLVGLVGGAGFTFAITAGTDLSIGYRYKNFNKHITTPAAIPVFGAEYTAAQVHEARVELLTHF